MAHNISELNEQNVLQSGSALAEWALIENWERVQNTSKVFGRNLGCAVDSSWKLVNCLTQGRSFYEIGNAEFRVSKLEEPKSHSSNRTIRIHVK